MQNSVKLFLHFLITLTTFSIALNASANDTISCGFKIDDIAPKRVDGGVPLYVDRNDFDQEFFEQLSARAQIGKEALKGQIGSCPKTKAHIENVFNKLLKSSKLELLTKGDNGLKLLVLCNKPKMPPVAKLMSGEYLVVPSSLVLEAKNEDAVAAVLAHEIAHYSLAHHLRLMTQTKGRMPAMPLSWRNKLSEIRKVHEKEADLAGLKLMSNAGYDTASALEHLKYVDTLAKARKKVIASLSPGGPKTHPSALERSAHIWGQIKGCGYDSKRTASTISQGQKIPI